MLVKVKLFTVFWWALCGVDLLYENSFDEFLIFSLMNPFDPRKDKRFSMGVLE